MGGGGRATPSHQRGLVEQNTRGAWRRGGAGGSRQRYQVIRGTMNLQQELDGTRWSQEIESIVLGTGLAIATPGPGGGVEGWSGWLD